MRILVVSNLYPPHEIGGYELGCRDVVDALRSRGHDVTVVTSTYGVDAPSADDGVERRMIYLPRRTGGRAAHVAKVIRREWVNHGQLRRLCRRVRPQVVYIWCPRGLSMMLGATAEKLGAAVCYYIFDHWLADANTDSWVRYWQAARRGGLAGGLGAVLRPMAAMFKLPTDVGALAQQQVQFCTKFIEQGAADAGFAAANGRVIYWGLDMTQFPYPPKRDDVHRLLFVGRFSAQKGAHTAVEALHHVLQQRPQLDVSLTMVGDGDDEAYMRSLRERVEQFGLAQRVNWIGWQPRQQLVSIYGEHDVFLFPSIWAEPFGIVRLEAMACGMAVVSTSTGGTGEVLEHGRNALLFREDDSEHCAEQILRLCGDGALFAALGQRGRETVERTFSFERTVDEIEQSLEAACH